MGQMQLKKLIIISRRSITSLYLYSRLNVNKGHSFVGLRRSYETAPRVKSYRALWSVISRKREKPLTSELQLSAALSATSVALLLLLPCVAFAQKKARAVQPKPKVTQTKTEEKPAAQLAKLREEFINATREYKTSLEKLQASYEKSVAKAEVELSKSRDLFAAGLISKNKVEADEGIVAAAKDKVTEVKQRLAGADTQIAETLIEAEVEVQLARSKPLPRGGIVRSASFIRFNGGAAWVLSDAWKVQRFFLDTFKKPLPIAVFGQGAIHDRWRLDHHNSMDISLHPDGPEGQALLNFLRNSGIPFLAFRGAIPGTATGPHIHIGRPSHRY